MVGFRGHAVVDAAAPLMAGAGRLSPCVRGGSRPVVCAPLDVGLRALGASVFMLVLAGLLISLLAGLEAGTLRRSKLARRHWRNIGVVTGDDVEDAERRFFDVWIRQAPARRPASPPSAPTSGLSASAPPAAPSG